jgi:cardiolipin synthase
MTMTHEIRARLALLWVIACMMAGCETVPQRPVPDSPATSLRWENSRGPLSRRQVAEVYRHLAVGAPDTDELRRHLAIEQAISSSPLYTGNTVRVLKDGAETLPAMFTAIRSARTQVLLEYYIFDDINSEGQQLLELLAAKSAEGVIVAVLYDAIGSVSTDRAFLDALREAGVHVQVFNPIKPLQVHHWWSINNRDHRKMLIVDHGMAFLGGINLSKDYQSAPSARHAGPSAGGWRDTDIALSGPSVAELERLFHRNWQSQGGSHLATDQESAPMETAGNEVVHIIDSAPGTAPRFYATVLSSINAAEHSVWITAAYFVPTHAERRLLAATARRGVDVRLMLPSESDSKPVLAIQHASYEDLLEAGVKIYERKGVILHSKSMVIDDVWSIVGSSNLDHRSILYNGEVDAVIIGAETARSLAELFNADLGLAQQISLAAWKKRPLQERTREHFWRLWTKLL